MKRYGEWLLSSSSDKKALEVVDGLGRFEGRGPHYSRRSPGSATFTGVGKEIVLLHESGAAVWAVVYQRTPAKRGSGCSRGRKRERDHNTRFVWRNMLFRRMPECPRLASELITTATFATYEAWMDRYHSIPDERLRTEIDIHKVRSTNPGYCYLLAGYVKQKIVRGKLYLLAPIR
jgi:hypothetical protein